MDIRQLKLLLFKPLVLVLIGCTSAAQLASDGKLHFGMSKYALMDALVSTSLSEDPFLHGCFRHYDADRRIEIMAPESRSVFFVFRDVDAPSEGCSRRILGDGTLAGWKFSESSVMAFAETLPTTSSAHTPGESVMPGTGTPGRSPPRGGLQVVGSGTGFFINTDGHVLTNEHVVRGCSAIQTRRDGQSHSLTPIVKDSVNDLAVLRSDILLEGSLSFSVDGPKFGEEIVVAGFPLSNLLGESVKVTRGIVSSLSGPGNNSSVIQIDAAVQPGSSGGPILNTQGHVIGVIVAKANAQYFLEASGALPENVNFGVNVGTANVFLRGSNIAHVRGAVTDPEMPIHGVAREAERYTVQLLCLR